MVAWNHKEDCKVEKQELESSLLEAGFLSIVISDIWGWVSVAESVLCIIGCLAALLASIH